jgi:nitrogenase molybdenum-iron protein NifN
MSTPRRGPDKACAVDPFKLGPTVGAAMAILGIEGGLSLVHGSAGCAFSAVHALVHHFRVPVPIRSVELDEVSTILGGSEALDRALLEVVRSEAPALVGLIGTSAAEARGEDLACAVERFRIRHAAELARSGTELLSVAAPDFAGGLEEGWARTVERAVEALVQPAADRLKRQVNVLAGSHLTIGDVDELRELVESFGLAPILLPDLSRAVVGPFEGEDGRLRHGGTRLDELRSMGGSCFTLAFGAHMRQAARRLEAIAGVPFQVFDRILGLGPCDALVGALARISGRPAPQRLRRQRERLVEAMLDSAAVVGDRRVAVAGEPDQLADLVAWLRELGAEVTVAVASARPARLAVVEGHEAAVGDLADLEAGAARAQLLVASSTAARLAARLGVPLWRVGIPISDRLGSVQRVSLGYAGNRSVLFELADLLVSAAAPELSAALLAGA